MKTAHIISHSHWDREWYLPYESHHMRLIMLIDQVLQAIDNDPDFKSFHLDGQTICIDDYLQVKPQNREKVYNAIESGKLKIGPWYVLQDAFLTSSEANVRNLQYGDADCRRYGAKTKVGYFPDTFGIYKQAPQILKEAEIDNMIFGRGVSTTGFANQVSNQFESKFSEMRMRASSGDQVLGILFANWYSNGNEIPCDRKLAKQYWDQKLSDAMRYTNCEHLLFMNGCDHTPYQEDVTTAIKVANELYDDVTFVHSSFDEYLQAIKETVDEQSLTTIESELVSQTTDGRFTLVNTASSRIVQKIKNAKLQNMYEQLVEPLSALYANEYMHSEIEYGWKKLMQNHPHDSICGCSIDSVHDTMDARFEDSENVAKHVIERTLNEFKKNVDISCDNLAFTVFNPSELTNDLHCIEIEYDRALFANSYESARDMMKALVISDMQLVDDSGEAYDSVITDLGIKFGYYLPDDKFRRAYYARNIQVEFVAPVKPFSHQTFYLQKCLNKEYKREKKQYIENDLYKVSVNDDCTINIENKRNGKQLAKVLKIYDQGDIGNEYMFGQVANDVQIGLDEISSSVYEHSNVKEQVEINATLFIPKQADELLAKEQLEIVNYFERASKRSSQIIKMPITIRLILGAGNSGLKVEIEFENKAKDHRLRVSFENSCTTNTHKVDSAFEVIKRDNQPLPTWENDAFDRRMFKFIQIPCEDSTLTIATNGLHEYEIDKANNVYITLVRSVGELGDWGHFPTPEAQVLTPIKCELYINFDNKENDNYHGNKARTIFTPMPYIQVSKNKGTIPSTKTMLKLSHDDNSYLSALKRNQNDQLIIRFGSCGEDSLITCKNNLVKTNLLERDVKSTFDNVIAANKIVTLIVKQ